MKIAAKYSTLLILSITFLYAACDDGITPPPYDGPWEKVPVPDTIGYAALGFSAPNDGWVVGFGIVGHYDGKSWEVIKDFDKEDEDYFFGDIVVRAADDIWICGRVEETVEPYGNTGTIIHYDGQNWEEERFPELEWVSALWFFDDGTGWAGGGYGFMRYDGDDWSWVGSSPSPVGFYFNAPDDGWMASLGGVYQWDGVEWTKVVDMWGSSWFYDIDFAAPDDGWAVGESANYHYDGTAWKLYDPLYTKTLDSVHFLNDHFGWGGYGSTYFYDGETWTEYDISHGCYDIFCVSEEDVWATSDLGYYLHFSGFD